MKITQLLLALAMLVPVFSHGSAGMFDQFVFTSTNGGPLSFYDIGTPTANPDFQGTILGTFDRFATTLQVGGQQKSFKNSGTDVTSHSLFWRITELGGSFASVAMPFQVDLGGGNQRWGGDTQDANPDPIELSSNVFSGLNNGTYTLEVYSQITTNGVDAASTIFNNNGGANFTATFTLVPEPSRVMLACLGFAGLIVRRRRC